MIWRADSMYPSVVSPVPNERGRIALPIDLPDWTLMPSVLVYFLGGGKIEVGPFVLPS
jgi:hypothetical protein